MPLFLAAAQQAGRAGRAARDGARDDDDRFEWSGPAQSRFRGPTAPARALIEDGEALGFARERCEPVLVPREGGRAWLLCVEYEAGVGDRIALREVGADGKLERPEAPPVLVCAVPGAVVRPVAAMDASGRLVVVWTEVVGALGNGAAPGFAQLRVARGSEKGFEPPVAIGGGRGAVRRNVELLRHGDGTVWLAFEEWRAGEAGGRDSFDVALAPLLEGGLGDVVAAGGGEGSDLDPVLASAGERIAIAWCSYRGRDYEILLRTFDPAQRALSEVLNVTADAAADDVHPSIAAAPDGAIWVAWDRLEDPARGASAPAEIREELGLPPRTGTAAASCSVRVACVRRGEVLVPRSYGFEGKAAEDGVLAGAPLHSFSGGTPRVVAAGGRIHVLWRFLARQGPGGKAYGFQVLASAVDSGGVAPPVMIEGSAGGPEEPAACSSGGGLIVAWQQDHRLECETGTLLRGIPAAHHNVLAKQGVVVTGSLGPSGIGLARIESAGEGVAAASSPRQARLEPPHFHPRGEALRDPVVSGSDHLRVEAGGREYRVFFGDLHRHSSVSRCSRGFEPGPADRWASGRDTSLYDFMALTDHSSHVDPLAWWRLLKTCEIAGSPGFVALAGFEWTTGKYGHQNVILRGGLRPFLSNGLPQLSTPPGLHAALSPEFAIAIPHHPADVTRRTDFAQCDSPVVRLVEVYQAQRGSYEFDGCFKQSRSAHAMGSFATDALARGLKVGFVASTDHGEGTAYACALAESLDRDHVFEALRARRTYGATAKGMLVDLRVNGRLMGEELEVDAASAAAVKVSLRALGTAELAEVVVFRNGEPWKVLGRRPRDPAGRTELTLALLLDPPRAPRERDWSLTLAAGESSGVEMSSLFAIPPYARDELGPDRPEWKVEGGTAIHLWKGGYANYWEPTYSRLRLRGPRGAVVRVEARVGAGGEGGASPPVADFSRDVTIAELASGRVEVAGAAPFGPWRLAARESFDATVDLQHGLGVRELIQDWTDDALPPGPTWYYARFLQTDGELAWSSPIFLTRR